ncbi:hypothetical protein M527_13430 [Sphingobium indicum IP26]|uniref:lysylphosphatidylglycerol synthase domain-containing protein n=1 Tax=Sphingobium indicum TaxID=332055 RepID=UPI00037D5C6B|nr:hypothetical protein M527_13430 [Sphingobium indicum IP26]
MMIIRHMPILQGWWNWSAQFRKPLLLAALAVFAAGTAWAACNLGIGPKQINGVALIMLLCLSPVSLGYSGLGMQLMARAAGTSIPFGRSIVTSAIAILAEVLPVPGGAVVRTGALMKAGVGLGRGSILVLLAALLWITLGALGAGLAVIRLNTVAGWTLVSIGVAGSITVTGWLCWLSGWPLACLMLTHRLSGLALIAFRLYLAFGVVGVAVPFTQTMPFVLATIAGSAAAIAPAGLGVSEALAAVAATAMAVSPAAAFLAVGLDRIVHLLLSAAIAFCLLVRSPGGNRAPYLPRKAKPSS